MHLLQLKQKTNTYQSIAIYLLNAFEIYFVRISLYKIKDMYYKTKNGACCCGILITLQMFFIMEIISVILKQVYCNSLQIVFLFCGIINNFLLFGRIFLNIFSSNDMHMVMIIVMIMVIAQLLC